MIAAVAVDGEVNEEQWQIIFYIGAAVGATGGLTWLFFGKNSLQDWAKTDKMRNQDPPKMKEDKTN